MSLLWNLFRAVFLFLLSAVALAAVLAYYKEIGAYLRRAGVFIVKYWKPFTISVGVIIVGIVNLKLLIVIVFIIVPLGVVVFIFHKHVFISFPRQLLKLGYCPIKCCSRSR